MTKFFDDIFFWLDHAGPHQLTLVILGAIITGLSVFGLLLYLIGPLLILGIIIAAVLGGIYVFVYNIVTDGF